MKIINENDLTGTERVVRGEGFVSLRYLLEKDCMGFSVHKTIIPIGGPYHWHYKNHLEACFCVSGSGVITNLAEPRIGYQIKPGTLYALDKNDDHSFEAFENTILISIFNPPVKGQEVHQEDGSYSA